MPRHLLVDDMLDDLDGSDILNMIDRKAGLPIEDHERMSLDYATRAKLDFPKIWEIWERHHAFFEAAERDRDARAKAEELKFSPSTVHARKRKTYWKDPVAARAKARERMRNMRVRQRAARS